MDKELQEFRSSKYKLIRRLGKGGSGTVFLARDLVLDREVAIKFLRRDRINRGRRQRLAKEAAILAQLNHPNVTQIFDFIENDEHSAFVMEHISGSDLYTFLRENRVDCVQRIRWLLEIAEGIRAAHHEGIVHNDLKAENVLISSTGTAKVTDFGISGYDLDVSQDVLSLGELGKTLLENCSPSSGDASSLFDRCLSRSSRQRPTMDEICTELKQLWLAR